MEYIYLGKSQLKVSRFGFGCMSLPADQKESESLITQALDKGVNFFDTADLYEKGENEIRVGQALHTRRKDVILATKVGNRWRADGSGWDWSPSGAYITGAVEQSLKRLRTDYIDLYQLHGGTVEDPADEIVETFEKLKREGKIRYYGISSIRPNVIRSYVEHSRIASVMMQYSLLDRRPDESITALLKEHEIGMIARGSLAQGLLTGKEPKNYLSYSAEEVGKAARAIMAVSGLHRSPAQTALRYVLHQPAVQVALVGIRTSAQLSDALGAFDTSILNTDEITILEESIQALAYTDHR
ncbi:aldo/keto reductase [Desertivirga xinjiangensis]|uniref:aldo/keto reductase n=1 Tax=Desertivirga xinjiangensis TaxID=539206 RepID=UPI00210A3757|nr:aldo/keto reductase [Pedobacter xinjiangensis]